MLLALLWAPLTVSLLSLAVSFSPAHGAPKKAGSAKYARFYSSPEEYKDCVGRMPGHDQAGDGEIRVCMKGNGKYFLPAHRTALEKDWFPTSGLIEEVRFVCSESRKAIPKESRLIYPTKAELEKGLGARLEIPCHFDEKKTEAALKNAQAVIRDGMSNPAKFARDANLIADNCDKRPKQRDCRDFALIAAVTGEADELLTMNARYCGLPLALKVGRPVHFGKPLAIRIGSGNGSDALDAPDLLTEINLGDLDGFDKYDQWVEDVFPKSCEATDKETGAPAKAFSLADCLKDFERIKVLLEKKGLAFTPGKDAFLNGKHCFDKTKTGAAVPAICQVAFKFDRGLLYAFAEEAGRFPIQLRDPPAPAMEGFDQSFFAATSLEFGAKGQLKLISSPLAEDTCGWNIDCWKRSQALLAALGKAAGTTPMEKGCYGVKSADFSQSPPRLEFVPLPCND